MDSPDPVTPPDPNKTSQAQWGYTKNAANFTSGLNAPNVYTPWGSNTFQKDPSGRVLSQTVSLDPAQQGLLDSQRGLSAGLLGQAQNYLGRLPQDKFSLASLGMQVPGQQDYGAWGDKVTQASFDKARGLLDPVFSQQDATLRQSLADRGQPDTGQGFQTEYGNFNRARNDAYTNAANDAVLRGGTEMDRMSGIQNRDFGTSLTAALTERGLPLQELGGLLGTAPQFNQPQQQNLPAINAAAPDFMGAQNMATNVQLQNAAQQQAQNNAIWGAVGSLGGAATSAALGPGGFLR